MEKIELVRQDVIQKIWELDSTKGSAFNIAANSLIDLGIDENTAYACSILQALRKFGFLEYLKKNPAGINFEGIWQITTYEEQGRYCGDWPLPYRYFDGYELVFWYGNSQSAILICDDETTYFDRGYITKENAPLIIQIISGWAGMSDVVKFLEERFSITSQ